MAGSMIEDQRFQGMYVDPRFNRAPAKVRKVEIDSRFNRMFDDASFQMRAPVDKRGRKIKRSKVADDFQRYYRLKDEDEWGVKLEGKSPKGRQGEATGEGAFHVDHGKSDQGKKDSKRGGASQGSDRRRGGPGDEGISQNVTGRAGGIEPATSCPEQEQLQRSFESKKKKKKKIKKTDSIGEETQENQTRQKQKKRKDEDLHISNEHTPRDLVAQPSAKLVRSRKERRGTEVHERSTGADVPEGEEAGVGVKQSRRPSAPSRKAMSGVVLHASHRAELKATKASSRTPAATPAASHALHEVDGGRQGMGRGTRALTNQVRAPAEGASGESESCESSGSEGSPQRPARGSGRGAAPPLPLGMRGNSSYGSESSSESGRGSLDEDEEEAAEDAAVAAAEGGSGGPSGDSDSGSGSGDEGLEEAAARRWRLARGLEEPDSPSSSEAEEGSSEDWSDDAMDGASEDDLDLADWGVGGLAANPEEAIPESEETSRLAVVDLDWSQVRAVDIFAVLTSFCKPNQEIKQVTVYLSDYGKECLAEEAKKGPTLFWKYGGGTAAEDRGASGGPRDTDDRESDQEASGCEDGQQRRPRKEGRARGREAGGGQEGPGEKKKKRRKGKGGGADENGEFDPRQLQVYERSRLRYYYAIVECDSVATAANLYGQCNGLELLRSANLLDLRYVAEGESFAGREVRDSACEIPAGYEPPNFQTAALQLTNVKLTWDSADPSRKAAFQKLARLSADDLKDDDFKAYLGSDSEDEEEQAAAGAAAYKALLQQAGSGTGSQRTGGKDWAAPQDDGGTSDGTSDGEDGAERNGNGALDSRSHTLPVGLGEGRGGGMDMQVTFRPGLLDWSLPSGAKGAAKKAGKELARKLVLRQRDKAIAHAKAGRRYYSEDESDGDGVDSDVSAERAAEEGDFFVHPDNPFEDPFFAEQEGGQPVEEAAGGGGAHAGLPDKEEAAKARQAAREARREAVREAKRKQQELDLLMLDDSRLHELAVLGGREGSAAAPGGQAQAQAGSKRKASVKERARAKKLSRKAEREGGSDDERLQDGSAFTADFADPRFKALFESPDYALDPTDPRYRKASGLLQHMKTARSAAPVEPGPSSHKEADVATSPARGQERGDVAFAAMVSNLKRKVQQRKGGQR